MAADRVIRWSTAGVVIGVAAVAAAASYEHAYDLVRAHGEAGRRGLRSCAGPSMSTSRRVAASGLRPTSGRSPRYESAAVTVASLSLLEQLPSTRKDGSAYPRSPSTSANATRTSSMCRPCSPSPGAWSTSCGHCCATTGPGARSRHRRSPPLRLDEITEILLARAGMRRGRGWPGAPRRVSRRRGCPDPGLRPAVPGHPGAGRSGGAARRESRCRPGRAG
jgi:hypothetical protein